MNLLLDYYINESVMSARTNQNVNGGLHSSQDQNFQQNYSYQSQPFQNFSHQSQMTQQNFPQNQYSQPPQNQFPNFSQCASSSQIYQEEPMVGNNATQFQNFGSLGENEMENRQPVRHRFSQNYGQNEYDEGLSHVNWNSERNQFYRKFSDQNQISHNNFQCPKNSYGQNGYENGHSRPNWDSDRNQFGQQNFCEFPNQIPQTNSQKLALQNGQNEFYPARKIHGEIFQNWTEDESWREQKPVRYAQACQQHHQISYQRPLIQQFDEHPKNIQMRSESEHDPNKQHLKGFEKVQNQFEGAKIPFQPIVTTKKEKPTQQQILMEMHSISEWDGNQQILNGSFSRIFVEKSQKARFPYNSKPFPIKVKEFGSQILVDNHIPKNFLNFNPEKLPFDPIQFHPHQSLTNPNNGWKCIKILCQKIVQSPNLIRRKRLKRYRKMDLKRKPIDWKRN